MTPQQEITPLKPKAPQNDSVAGIAANIMNNDSPLMKAADTKGRQVGNSRGMLNSSLSAGTGIRAALDYVTPMAQQESSQRAQVKAAEQGFQYDNQLVDKSFKQNLQSMDAQAGYGKEQQARAAGYDSQLADKQAGYAFGQQAKAAEFDAAAQERSIAAEGQMKAAGFNFEAEEAELQRKQQTMLAKMDLGANNSRTAQAMITDFQKNYSAVISTIFANTEIPADERTNYINAAKAQLEKQTRMVETMFSVAIDW